ncbi:hypothetical protein B0T20DRAFT_429495 [Sordaria brevicollis]|uniref:Zn(2)-C6 fungal-type domain-containing protein n=1 Tax=Sordaria brevicollis TaxID=83679 RepID=A0AAE0PNT2_SORBR|nr:hypothetical protein B0T20DRAFT_429495 [Sordaria brevicollis]
MGPSRDACDRCHTMKTRCQRTPQTRECVRCNRLGISCTYSPPGRTGRPLGARKGSSEKGKKEAAAKSRKGRVPPLVKTHMPPSMGRTPGLDHSLPVMSGETSGIDPSFLGDFDLFSASAYQAELDYLSFPFMDSFLAESSGGDFTFAFANAMDAHPSSHSSGSSSPSGSSLHSPVTPQQSFRHQSSSHHDHHRTWSMTSATTDPTDLDSPFPLFTENIFSPSFIPKPPQSQCFPSDENSCDDDDRSEEDVLARLVDLQARISNLVKRLHEDRGSSSTSSNDCRDIHSAGKSLIALLDGVAIPSRTMMSEPASPMSTSSSSTSSAGSSLGQTAMPNNVLILSLSSCYATLLHAYELLLDSHNSASTASHLHTPLLSPASSTASSMSSSPEEQQGYFFSNGLRLPITPITPVTPGKSDDIQIKAMAQVMQKLKYALRRCTVRMSGQAGRGHGQGSEQSQRSSSISKNKKRKAAETKTNGDDDMFSVLGLASPTLLDMGWTEEVLWQQQQSLGFSW